MRTGCRVAKLDGGGSSARIAGRSGPHGKVDSVCTRNNGTALHKDRASPLPLMQCGVSHAVVDLRAGRNAPLPVPIAMERTGCAPGEDIRARAAGALLDCNPII